MNKNRLSKQQKDNYGTIRRANIRKVNKKMWSDLLSSKRSDDGQIKRKQNVVYNELAKGNYNCVKMPMEPKF